MISANPARILGFDYGDKRTGVAVSDPFGWTAQGLETIHGNMNEAVRRAGELILQYDAGIVVVGYPKNMNGSAGIRAERTEKFIAALNAHTGGHIGEIIKWDERLTTVEAARAIKDSGGRPSSRREREKGRLDVISAVLLLQSYLDYRRSE